MSILTQNYGSADRSSGSSDCYNECDPPFCRSFIVPWFNNLSNKTEARKESSSFPAWDFHRKSSGSSGPLECFKIMITIIVDRGMRRGSESVERVEIVVARIVLLT
jgi:hypothetical protein